MINWNGKRRWVALLMLIAGILVMLFVPPIIPVIQLPGEVYPGPADGFRLTNSLVGSVVVWILLILLVIYVNRKMPKSGDEVPPGGFYNIFELLFEGLYGFIHNIVGEKHMRYIFSFFMTIFLIVLLSNWLELVPGVDSIGFLEPHAHVDETSGQVVYEGGYETVNSGGIYVLNPKCPWISPEEAVTMTTDEQASRAAAGCLTGSGAPVEEVHEDTEAVVASESVPADAEGAVQETGDLGEAEAGSHEIHAEAGSPSVPWVVLPFLRAPGDAGLSGTHRLRDRHRNFRPQCARTRNRSACQQMVTSWLQTFAFLMTIVIEFSNTPCVVAHYFDGLILDSV
ncbi:MAG: F0F1 ATP synthase subunit A [Anaerolineae bacterium]